MQRIPGKSNYTLQKSGLDIAIVVAMVGGLLLLRDVGGMGMNKYIFLLIIGAAVVIMPIEKVMYLICFSMPLYVGMPGNYITMAFLVRFLMEAKKIKISASNWILCVLAGGYALLQALIFKTTEIPQLMFFPSMILVVMMYSLETPCNKNKMVLYYAMGTAIMGLIMFTSTLRHFDVEDLLNTATRLGDNSTQLTDDGVMKVAMDPNFYGMLVIAALSTGMGILLDGKKSLGKIEKVLLIASIVTGIVVALIGLSRAFFLTAIIWAFLYLLSRKKVKTFTMFIALMVLAVLLISQLMPDVLEAVLARFKEDNTEEGGGRLDLIRKFYEMWKTDAWTLLFGTNLFECEVHCTPLQVLFGGGLVFSGLFTGFVVSLPRREKKVDRHTFLQRWLPFMVTALVSTTLPAFLLINSMFPLILTGMYRLEEKE